MSPRGGAHDKGDPADMLGYEEAWTTAETSANPAEAGTETVGNVPSSAVQDPPVVSEQAMPPVAPVRGMGSDVPSEHSSDRGGRLQGQLL